MELFKIMGTAFIIALTVFVLAFAFTGADFVMLKFWGPKYEDTKREIFEESQSYVHGKNTYIARLRLDYESADGTRRLSLRRLILEESSTIQFKNLTSANKLFVQSLQGDN